MKIQVKVKASYKLAAALKKIKVKKVKKIKVKKVKKAAKKPSAKKAGAKKGGSTACCVQHAYVSIKNIPDNISPANCSQEALNKEARRS